MSKTLKKGLAIGGGVVALILGFMILVPFLFKGKIKEAVVRIANENVNAKIDIEDFGLNLFRNFPNATLTLYNTSVVGVDSFATDTLLQAKDISITINLKSLFGNEYEVNNILLADVDILTKINKDGAANWEISKPNDDQNTNDSIQKKSAFKLDLKDIEIKNASFRYIDLESDIEAILFGINGKILGDFSANETSLKTKATAENLSLYMDGVPCLSEIHLRADATLHADFDKMKFTFTDSKFYLNDLLAVIEGSFAFVGDDGYNFDLQLKAPNANFRQVLSLIPAMYNEELKTLKTSGSISLDAYLVGDMVGDEYPAINLRMIVTNAMFQYPQLPKPVEDINLFLNVSGKASNINNLKIDIDKFGFRIDDNKVEGSVNISPLMNDQYIDAKLDGKINLASIKEVYPMPQDTQLDGLVTASIGIKTTKSAVVEERYSAVDAKGSLQLANMYFKDKDFLDLAIKLLDVNFTSNSFNLKKLDMTIGDSDLEAEGSLQNILGYLFNNQTIKGNLDLRSETLNLDQLTQSMSSTTSVDTTNTTGLAKIIIPTNIDFVLRTNLALVIFNNMNISNASGKVIVKDGTLTLEKLSAGILGGLTTMNAKYVSSTEYPELELELDLTRGSFANTFKSIETIRKFAPIFSDISGTYSMSLNLKATVYDDYSQTLNTLNATGNLFTNDFRLENNSAMKSLGALLKTDKLDILKSKNINLPFEIKDGELITQPFNIAFSDGGMLSLQGVTKLNQSIDYRGSITLPTALSNKYISKIPLSITGTFTDPKIAIDTEAAATDVIGSVIGGLLDTKNEDGTSSGLDLNEEKEKKIAELRENADKFAEKLVTTAKEQAAELEKKSGSNPLAQMAAKKGGEELVKKAEEEAQKLRYKAEEEIKKLDEQD